MYSMLSCGLVVCICEAGNYLRNICLRWVRGKYKVLVCASVLEYTEGRAMNGGSPEYLCCHVGQECGGRLMTAFTRCLFSEGSER